MAPVVFHLSLGADCEWMRKTKDTQINSELKRVLELVGQLMYNQKHARKSVHAGVVLKSMGHEASVACNCFWVKGLT